MRTIHKHPIPAVNKAFQLLLQEGASFLRLAFQGEQLQMWADVDTDNPKVIHNFAVFGTGHEIPKTAKYLATYDVGPLVLHLYQI